MGALFFKKGKETVGTAPKDFFDLSCVDIDNNKVNFSQ